jgi:hypothetical protein
MMETIWARSIQPTSRLSTSSPPAQRPDTVAHFRPSTEAQQRVAALIEREKASRLSIEEKAELDHFLELEHILRMAKAKARQILASGQ